MALTLVENSKVAAGRDEFHVAAIMELFARTSDLLTILPFETFQGSTYKYTREKNLPSVGGRALNDGYVEDTGEWSVESVTLKPSGGDVDVDTYFIRTNGPGVVERVVDAKTKAMALWMTKQIVKGDALSDVKAFDGLQAQITPGQTVVNSPTGAALSLVNLDELIDTTEDPTHLCMNKTLRRRLSASARNTAVGGYITYDLDAFGRQVTQYNNVPICIVDKDEANAPIMPFSEATGGASSSIYCLSVSANGVKMLQSSPMQVRPLGEMNDKPVLRTRVEWDTCLAVEREMSASRLSGVTNAAVLI
jgi:hypothetical protein